MNLVKNDAAIVERVEPANETALRRLARVDRLRALMLSSPGLVLVGVLLLIPLSWLVGQSLLDASGRWALVNYRTLLEPVYVRSIMTTLELSLMVTVGVSLIGYPIAYLLSQLPKRVAGLLMIAVLLPYWTSTLVRTFSWLVLLQRNGIINTVLISNGIIASPLHLVNNMTGAVIGMIHVMTQVLIMPLYGSMKSIDPTLMRAASNCGATPREAFWHVFFPQTLPGLLAGVLMVFVISLGYYVTPALLGGGNVNVLAMQIQTTLSTEGDWGLVSALGVVLIAIAAVISVLLNGIIRLSGLNGDR